MLGCGITFNGKPFIFLSTLNFVVIGVGNGGIIFPNTKFERLMFSSPTQLFVRACVFTRVFYLFRSLWKSFFWWY